MNKDLRRGIAFTVVIIGLGVLVALSTARNDQQPDIEAPRTSPTSTQPVVATAAASAAVTIEDFKYVQKDLKVKKGTTITWTNQDESQHTVTSENNGPLQSPRFGKNGTFRYTFNEVGKFSYFCEPHPYMKGSVEVTE